MSNVPDQAALAAGKCVVIGLQSTGEARTLDVIAERAVDGELDDFVSGPKVRLMFRWITCFLLARLRANASCIVKCKSHAASDGKLPAQCSACLHRARRCL